MNGDYHKQLKLNFALIQRSEYSMMQAAKYQSSIAIPPLTQKDVFKVIISCHQRIYSTIIYDIGDGNELGIYTYWRWQVPLKLLTH